ncbi:hypothetical protein F511_24930 [Dorcoceras hygrometricum]|uniref:Uncharacterized protein n=1 Tax=Dorcoceras hygrometricum TaxID=472368 RepID=A0A2Z7B094_9LAMI|nr:hypothetical protein F511_24930 [Dorcoceras hygrometricum]
MSNVEQEADNSIRKSEESDVVLKNQQMVRVQQMATEEWIQQKRKDKDSADGFALRISSRGKSSRKHLKPTTGQPAASISLPPAARPDASNSTSSPISYLLLQTLVELLFTVNFHRRFPLHAASVFGDLSGAGFPLLSSFVCYHFRDDCIALEVETRSCWTSKLLRKVCACVFLLA